MPDPLATLGGGAADNAERISALHLQKSWASINQNKAQFAADVNVDIKRHTQERQAAFETYLETEKTPVAGQPNLQALIEAGSRPGVNPNSPEAQKGAAAQQIKTQLEANQKIRRDNLRTVGTNLEDTFTRLIPQTDTRSTIATEITQVLHAKEVHLNELLSAKTAAVASVNALYTDANKQLLKNAYAIGDAEVAEMQTRHVQNVKTEYDKHINGAKTYLDQLYKDYLEAEKRIEKNFKTETLFGKFFTHQMGDAIAGVGGDLSLQEKERIINEATTFTINVAPDRSFTNAFGLFDTSSPEVKIHKTPEGKLMIALDDINPSSIEALLDIAEQQGKTTINLNFEPSDPKNKDKEERAKSMVAWAAAVRGLKVNGAKPFSLEALQRLNLIREQQRHVRAMINDQEATQTKAAGKGLIFIDEISKRIQGRKNAVESLSNEFRTLAAAPAGDALLATKANELIAGQVRLGNEIAQLRANNAAPQIIAAKQAEFDNIQLLQVARMAGTPEGVKDRILLHHYNKIKDQRNILAELIDNQFSGLASLRGDVNPRFDRLRPQQKEAILNALRAGYANINDGIAAEKRLHESPAGSPIRSVEEIIHNRATANPAILGAADTEMARFHRNTTQHHEGVAQDELLNQNRLQAQVPAPDPVRPRR